MINIIYEEIERDLFTVSKDYVLAHCISEDCRMGAGIAKQFTRKYPNMRRELLLMNPKIGQSLYYSENNLSHNIINLITKSKYYHKPTRDNFNKSIINMKELLIKNNIKKLAIPRIGSKLDRLNWSISREFIIGLFNDTDIEILVCIWE